MRLIGGNSKNKSNKKIINPFDKNPQFCNEDNAPRLTCKIAGTNLPGYMYEYFVVLGFSYDGTEVTMNAPVVNIAEGLIELQKAFTEMLEQIPQKDKEVVLKSIIDRCGEEIIPFLLDVEVKNREV